MPLAAARKVVYDTNIYVRAMQLGPGSREYNLLQSSLPSTYLSSVVSAELNVGARDLAGLKLLRQFLSSTERVGRLVTPTHRSWNQAGQILGAIDKSQPRYRSKLPTIFNDALIALCALQIGAVVCAGDKEDFDLLRRYRKFDLVLVEVG